MKQKREGTKVKARHDYLITKLNSDKAEQKAKVDSYLFWFYVVHVTKIIEKYRKRRSRI